MTLVEDKQMHSRGAVQWGFVGERLGFNSSTPTGTSVDLWARSRVGDQWMGPPTTAKGNLRVLRGSLARLTQQSSR